LVASVQSIMTDLSLWLRELPEYLHLDFNKIENQIITRESVSIFLHYYQCINMTARPLVFHVVQKRLQDSLRTKTSLDWRDGLSQTTIAVIESCVIAARASATVLSASAKQNLVGKGLTPYC
jgi:proline utilization trans-activator